MKTIVVSGARSNVGKTALAGAIRRLLPGAVHVKIGHGKRKPGGGNAFYPVGTPWERIAEAHGNAPWLVVESNRVLAEIDADCVVYLAADRPKPSAALARRRADIVRGLPVGAGELRRLATELGVDEETMRRIAQLAGATEQGGETGTRVADEAAAKRKRET
ncbi:MAG: hypothetical protein JW876_04375 [Candidatus Krumholzibacteriota bacterium]|nr:hypothetical protein [Candidatus Krumholzibacteriota bacterium]